MRSFNRLARPRTTPSGLPNHWVFGVRHVPLEPPGDLVVAVHPRSDFFLQGGPGQILSSSSVSDKAQALLPFLLDAFVKGSQSPLGSERTDPPPFAPWTWATEDPELAKALEELLSQYGVVNELCRVGTCSGDDKHILEEAWSGVYRTMTSLIGGGSAVTPGDTTRCHGCGLSGESFSEPLKKCSACGKAWYHSQDCQRKHWKKHKPACLANRPTKPKTDSSASSASAAGSKVDAHKYYNTTARLSSEAQALMSTLYLSFPPSPTATEGIAKPLRSLIYAGKDTPENMQALFGPDWRRSIGKHHDEARLDVLLDPPRGSPSYALHQWLSPDNRLERSPRPATDAEQQMIGKVREMQDAVRRRIGAGKSPSSADMQAILSSYGLDWTSHVQTYTLAINAMDQGVRR